MGFEKIRRPLSGRMISGSRRGSITATQYKALFTTPQTIVPAPGAGWANVFDRIVLYKQAGTAYNAANNIVVRYTDASGLEVGQIATSGFADQTTVQTRVGRHHAAASGANSFTPVANSPLVLHVLVADPTTGTGSFQYRVWYTIVPTVP